MVSRQFIWSIIIALIFFTAMVAVEIHNERFYMNDFKVYYEASSDFLSGKNPYHEAYGLSSGYYKYAPATLPFFALYHVAHFEAAKMIHYLICSAMFVLSLIMIVNYLKPTNKSNNSRYLLLFAIGLVVAAVHLTREMHLGNINLVLIFLVVAFAFMYGKNHKLVATACFAAVLLLKPYMILLGLPLIFKREWKMIFQTAAIIILLSIVPILFTGLDMFISMYKAWFNNMLTHNEGMFSEHTITSIINAYTGLSLTPTWNFIFYLIAGLLFIMLRFSYFTRYKQYTQPLFLLDIFAQLAILPNLMITDSQHFLFTIPLVCLLIFYLIKENRLLNWVVFTLLIFFYGANSNDLLGNPLSDTFDRYSTIGLANLLLIGWTWVIWNKKIKRQEITFSSL
ncbi:MAG: DUF2029 domain-containing protein [Crocinitomicaceae bacterium]|nr:DUF2029 domain-containing protein [Crocinitomicaceae bacterium]MBK8925813.1 DUF2029 domain-containing protein [Crocinitomicaceae bacterium]